MTGEVQECRAVVYAHSVAPAAPLPQPMLARSGLLEADMLHVVLDRFAGAAYERGMELIEGAPSPFLDSAAKAVYRHWRGDGAGRLAPPHPLGSSSWTADSSEEVRT